MKTVTHLQITMMMREHRGDDALHDRTFSTQRQRRTASYIHRDARRRIVRHNGGYSFFGPGWMLPQKVPQRLQTISASIVWGIYGKMADVPEY